MRKLAVLIAIPLLAYLVVQFSRGALMAVDLWMDDRG